MTKLSLIDPNSTYEIAHKLNKINAKCKSCDKIAIKNVLSF